MKRITTDVTGVFSYEENGIPDASISFSPLVNLSYYLNFSTDGNGNLSPIPLVQSGFFTPNDVKDMKSIRISSGEGQKQVILVANNNYLLQAIQFDPGSLKARKAQLSNLK